MEDYNIHGWTALHEACYKGYLNAVNKILDYANSTGKNLIEMKTNDEFKTTPFMIAALGGHMDVIELLYKSGANINAELYFRENQKHGIIEVAAIKQHIDLLVFMFDKIPDSSKKIRNLMLSDIIDQESRASLGRTIEILSQDYPSMTAKLSKFKPETHASRALVLFRGPQFITYRLMQEDNFGYCLACFLKLSENNVESISSAVITLVNVVHNDSIRLSFIENKGVNFLISNMQKHKKHLNKMYKFYFYKIIFFKLSCKALDSRNQKSGDEDSSDLIDKTIQSIKLSLDDDNSNDFNTQATEEDIFDNFVECGSIGQAFCALSKYDEFLNLINKDGSNEKIIKYTKMLFELNVLKKIYDISKLEYEMRQIDIDLNIGGFSNSNKYVLFEQYIGGFIICLGNMAHTNNINKFFFLNSDLYELIMGFWKYIEIKSVDHKQIFGDIFYSNYNFLKKIDLYNFLDKKSNSILMQTASQHFDNEFDRLHNQKTKSTSKGRFSSDLIKNLQLSIIECIGKVFYNNFDLKNKYAYTYDDFAMSIMVETQLDEIFEWTKITNIFIKTLIGYLDSNISNDKELQFQVLHFLRSTTVGDLEMQNRIIHIRNAANSGLISSFRNLLRKSSPFYIRKPALIAIWTLSGDKNYQKTLDRKCIIYKAIGTQKFVDVLFDADDELSLICLEALESIANGPPYRDSSNQLIKVLYDVSKVQAVPAILRLFKNKNPDIILACLKTISSLCVSLSYTVCEKNQNLMIKLNGLNSILEICVSPDSSNRLKSEAYYCLSLICLKNSNALNELTNLIDIDNLIQNIMNLLRAQSMNVLDSKVIEKDKIKSFKNKTLIKIDEHPEDNNQIIQNIKCQIKAGLTFCSFSFQNDDFLRKIVQAAGKIDWKIYKEIIETLNKILKKSTSEKNDEAYFNAQKMRCLLGYQITILYNLFNNVDEDPRALGIKMMIDIIPYSTNTALRSISCDYLGRMVKFNITLIESLLCVNSIELLANSTLEKNADDVNLNVGITEKGVAALTLGILTNLNPEARRRFLKVARRYPSIMEELKYTNDILHIDLINEWKHFKQLRELVDKNENMSDRSTNTKFKSKSQIANKSIDTSRKQKKNKYFQNVFV